MEREHVIRVGILAIQGAFAEQGVAIRKVASELRIPIECCEVRCREDICQSLDGLIIPGGESTSISLFMKRNHMEDVLREWTRTGCHVTWGTCAGLIMLADQIDNAKIGGQPRLGGISAVVERNYFGRQINSFESPLNVHEPSLSQGPFNGVFIRAPRILKVLSDDAIVLATVTTTPDARGIGASFKRDILASDTDSHDVIVAVRHGNLLGTAFHPELTDDTRWHEYFIRMILEARKKD